MNLTKSFLWLATFAVLGVIALSQLAIPSVVAFLVGLAGATLVFILTSQNSSAQQESQMATTTLYVGNLPYKANESNVKNLFSDYGEVFAVRLMKDKRTGKRRGFGFVVMPEADAQKAITKLNESSYMERTLKVRVANDPKNPESENSQYD
ncbi:RNA recognition motif domain-containing protein [Vibrio rhizosphaerae]|uniref:RNA-binding protein n=1 Tax=Vibrio rhizosphaerae TaxID=398736 RepID=A0ABU4IPE4_9VIBR|nr:RNA-binding protein [Vibrio rhizosphaerae]MDW6091225.1 RNA-binding protein [Vibrio rhizosphaerae]